MIFPVCLLVNIDTRLTRAHNMNNRQIFNLLFNKMNTIKQLPLLMTFAEVALQGSFTKAAKILGMSKSAVSQQITRLEKELDVQLLKRNTRGLSVTAIGQKLLKRCELLKDHVELAFVELANTEKGPRGKFSVIFPHALEKDIMIPALSQLCREFPGLEPNIIVTVEKLDLIKNKLDVAVFGGEPRDSNYRARPITTTKEFFCATPEFIRRYGQPESVEELQKLAWIANHWQINPIEITKETTNIPIKKIILREFARVNALPTSIELALQHLGMVLLPNTVCSPMIQTGKLVRIFPEIRGPSWPFYFIHPYQGQKPIHITRFYQLVKHYFLRCQVE